ncbi:hypothetical protein GCM10025791_20730 [Halioxenophilus aromaticivorans]|uniref:Uncharacterized protein n=1 Tax=Halioxenophilus aromaticivorans TaxID=1306992 RepID=A0AAV3U2D7_9ALTE
MHLRVYPRNAAPAQSLATLIKNVGMIDIFVTKLLALANAVTMVVPARANVFGGPSENDK